MTLPSLAALAAFEAVFRHGSVTSAARELHLTQSAVSHRLRALEDELGVDLLTRDGRGVRVTARGAQFAQAIGEALAALQAAIDAVAPRTQTRTALSISCSPSFAIRFLVPRLAAFRALYPQLELRVAADDAPVIPARAGVDACVRLAAGPLVGQTSEKLGDEVVFPVLSPRLLERGPPLAGARDLAHYTLLHDEALAHEPGRVGWRAWFSRVGARGVDTSGGVRFSHAYLAIEAALAGDGVVLARRTLVAEELARGRLVAPLPQRVPSGLAYWFVTAPSEGKGTLALRGLRAFLIDGLREAARCADAHLASMAGAAMRSAGARALRKADGARRSRERAGKARPKRGP